MAVHDRLGAQLTEVLHEVVDERVVVVDHEHRGIAQRRRSVGPHDREMLPVHVALVLGHLDPPLFRASRSQVDGHRAGARLALNDDRCPTTVNASELAEVRPSGPRPAMRDRLARAVDDRDAERGNGVRLAVMSLATAVRQRDTSHRYQLPSPGCA